jgi:hypothetical protein
MNFALENYKKKLVASYKSKQLVSLQCREKMLECIGFMI